MAIALARVAALVILASTEADALRKRTQRATSKEEGEVAGARCTTLSSAEAVLGWFRQPTVSTEHPWFNYLIWLDQAGLADAGGMSSVDPEGLVYVAPQSGSTWGINRCAQRQWTFFGNNISSAGESGLTYQGSEFMKDMPDDRCILDFDMNSARTEADISNYFWATYRTPLADAAMSCTITLNPHFHNLFLAVQNDVTDDSAQQFQTTLQTAAEREGDWGRRCCPGALAGAASAANDVIAACQPPAVNDCALWYRRNWPAAPGFGGYSVYAVAYASSGTWAPVQGYTTFDAKMEEIGVQSLCFEREE